MNNKAQICPGATYMTTDGTPVTALRSISPDRALFVAEEFSPTPFVSWEYNLVTPCVIELYRGGYYKTLDDALNEIDIPTTPTPTLKLYPYCPDCGEPRPVYVDLDASAEYLTEQITDQMICPECGQVVGAYRIDICEDDDTYSTVPLYHGPTN